MRLKPLHIGSSGVFTRIMHVKAAEVYNSSNIHVCLTSLFRQFSMGVPKHTSSTGERQGVLSHSSSNSELTMMPDMEDLCILNTVTPLKLFSNTSSITHGLKPV